MRHHSHPLRVSIILTVWTTTLVCSSAATAQSVVRETRSFDIRYLTQEIPSLRDPVRPTAGDLFLEPPYDSRPAAPISFSDDEESALDIAEPTIVGLRVSPDLLVEVIERNIAEDSWSNSRNSIEASEGRLVVTQTEDVLERIEAYLARLSARRAHMETVEIIIVPAAAARGISGPFLEDDRLEEIIATAGAGASRVSLTAYNEQIVETFRGRQRRVHEGARIDQTGVVPTQEPKVAVLPVGIRVEIRPTTIPGTGWTQLELGVTRLRDGRPRQRTNVPADPANGETVRATESSLRTVLLLEPGRVAFAGSFVEADDDDDGERSFAVFARSRQLLVRAEAEAQRVDPEKFLARVYDVGFLVNSLGGQFGAYSLENLVWLIPRLVDLEAWEDDRTEIEADGEDEEEGRQLRITAKAATHAAVREWIDQTVAARGRLACVRVENLEGTWAEILAVRSLSEDGVHLPEGWREKAAGRALHSRLVGLTYGLLDSTSTARSVSSETFVSGVSAVAGGTGFVVVERASTERAAVSEGFDFRGRVTSSAVTGFVGLDFGLGVADQRFGKTARFVARSTLPAGVSGTGDGSDLVREENPITIALPVQRTVQAGQAALVRERRDLIMRVHEGAPGRGRLIVVRAEIHKAIGKGE